jgi:hypothetical protein
MKFEWGITHRRREEGRKGRENKNYVHNSGNKINLRLKESK